MLKIMKQNTYVNEKENTCSYEIITEEGIKIIGIARCAEIDADFFNQYTGLYIASLRANIKLEKIRLSFFKELLKEINWLKNCSKKRSNNAYDNINSSYIAITNDIKDLQETIEMLEYELKEYIKGKNQLYDTLRKARKENMKEGKF